VIHVGEYFVLQIFVCSISLNYSRTSLFCSSYCCHSIVNTAVTVTCNENVLCKTCVISVVMYVLYVSCVFGEESSTCLSYVSKWAILTL
jgi:hypothetical protein